MAPIIFHGLERLLINCGAIFIAYLGYRLFMFGVEKGHGKLEAHSAVFKVVFSGSSPGLFFMVSGLVILVVSLVTGKVEIYEKETRRGSVKKVSSGIPNSTQNKTKRRYKRKEKNIVENKETEKESNVYWENSLSQHISKYIPKNPMKKETNNDNKRYYTERRINITSVMGKKTPSTILKPTMKLPQNTKEEDNKVISDR